MLSNSYNDSSDNSEAALSVLLLPILIGKRLSGAASSAFPSSSPSSVAGAIGNKLPCRREEERKYVLHRDDYGLKINERGCITFLTNDDFISSISPSSSQGIISSISPSSSQGIIIVPYDKKNVKSEIRIVWLDSHLLELIREGRWHYKTGPYSIDIDSIHDIKSLRL